jgi:hypothetical protein
MKKYITQILLFFATISYAQTSKPNPIDITDILSYKQFEQIKEFILTKGDTQTYCNMYSNNPHYRINNIELYLNPGFQSLIKDTEKKDLEIIDLHSLGKQRVVYNTLVLRIWNDKEYPFQYTFIGGDKNSQKVYLEPYWDTNETMNKRHSKIWKYLLEITSHINFTQNQLNNILSQ